MVTTVLLILKSFGIGIPIWIIMTTSLVFLILFILLAFTICIMSKSFKEANKAIINDAEKANPYKKAGFDSFELCSQGWQEAVNYLRKRLINE